MNLFVTLTLFFSTFMQTILVIPFSFNPQWVQYNLNSLSNLIVTSLLLVKMEDNKTYDFKLINRLIISFSYER